MKCHHWENPRILTAIIATELPEDPVVVIIKGPLFYVLLKIYRELCKPKKRREAAEAEQ